MSAPRESTDFPGTPFGPGDTITVAPALPDASHGDREPDHQALEHDDELELTALEQLHATDLLGDPDDASDVAASGEHDPSTSGGLTIYFVSAPTAILGHEPGAIFAAALEPALERRLIDRGQLERRQSSGRPARPAGATAPGNTTTGGST